MLIIQQHIHLQTPAILLGDTVVSVIKAICRHRYHILVQYRVFAEDSANTLRRLYLEISPELVYDACDLCRSTLELPRETLHI